MPELERQVSITRVELLELRDEKRLVQEGYELLDEKRILIATEIRQALARHRALTAALGERLSVVRQALAGALARHGLDELQTLPPYACPQARVMLESRNLLGLELISARLETGQCAYREAPINPSPEARTAALEHIAALETIIRLAATRVSLRRLVREYVRTERRARALENVLLPEIHQALGFIEEQLEGLDQEEAIRVRHGRAGMPGEKSTTNAA